MKQCPSCKTTYTDDTLSFCLADGTTLTAIIEEEPTVVRGNLRIEIPPENASLTVPQTAPASGGSAGKWIKVLAAIVLLGFLVLAAAGTLGFVFYYNSGGQFTITNISSTTPTPTASTSTLDTEKQRLQDELANLQKKVAEQNKTPANTQPFPSSDESPTVSATANSPGDGFLALRSEPNSETGARITKIPHGARIEIGACGDYITTSRNNRGRWCRAGYNGYSGWVFDFYVRY